MFEIQTLGLRHYYRTVSNINHYTNKAYRNLDINLILTTIYLSRPKIVLSFIIQQRINDQSTSAGTWNL